MILFVTGQYAGAQYLHPLIKKWSIKESPKWRLVATNLSRVYWDEVKVKYKEINNYSAKKISDYIDFLKPKLIVTSTSANIELETLFIIEAKKKLIPTASFIDIWTNYLLRFKYKEVLIFPDQILAIDDFCRDEMVKEGIEENLIKIIGQPYLESTLQDIPKIGSKLLLVSQPVNKNLGKTLGYDEGDFCEICSKILDIIGHDNVLATRHPEELNSKIKYKNGILWTPGNGIKDIAKSHTVLGMYSMQMVVGYLWGRKIASIQPGLCQEDPSVLSRQGLIPRFEEAKQVLKFLNEENSYSNNFLKKKLIGSIKRLEDFCISYL